MARALVWLALFSLALHPLGGALAAGQLHEHAGSQHEPVVQEQVAEASASGHDCHESVASEPTSGHGMPCLDCCLHGACCAFTPLCVTTPFASMHAHHRAALTVDPLRALPEKRLRPPIPVPAVS